MSNFAKLFYRNYGVLYHDLEYIKNPATREEVRQQLIKDGKIEE